MGLRKYGTGADQVVVGVEGTQEQEPADGLDRTASRRWTAEDEQDLQEESRDRQE